MIAIDTNILVYAHREDSAFFNAAAMAVKQIAEGGEDWAIPWPCLHEFLAIVTHPQIYKPPTSLKDALTQVEMWLEAPTLRLIGELSRHYWNVLKTSLESGKAVGPKIHDARVAAVCIENGVACLWTADRDFSRFPALKVENPLVAS